MHNKADYIFEWIVKIITLIPIFIFGAIIFVLTSNTWKFFTKFSWTRFFFDLKWDIQSANPNNINLGILPVLNGTIMITTIALIISIPFGVMSAIFINEYINKKYRHAFDIILEIAIGIPTIVYGYFGMTFLAPMLLKIFYFFRISISIDNALTAGITMAIMLAPLITFYTRSALINVPKSVRYASKALGATRMETIIYIVIPHANHGIIVGILLALLKALGETLIIIMVASNNAILSLSPTHPMTTITAQINNLINSDSEFESVRMLVTYALATILFILTALLNLFISRVKD